MMLCALPALAQNDGTLRAMLAASGFTDAASAAGAPDLDRVLTSSEFGVRDDSFVAAYYFDDEGANQSLGQLHVSRFDRPTNRWTHATGFDCDTSGAVVAVDVSARYVILTLHWNPSAGQGVVFDARTLRCLGTFEGFAHYELHDGVIVHSGNAVHFAPTHQYRLFAFDPRLHRRSEIFPGRRESPIALEYRSRIRAAYARLPPASREKLEHSEYGAVDDFDREFGEVVAAANDKTVGVAVYYGTDRLDMFAPLQTVVRCVRASRRWSCEERTIGQASRVTGISVSPDRNGRYDSAGVERLLRAWVNR